MMRTNGEHRSVANPSIKQPTATSILQRVGTRIGDWLEEPADVRATAIFRIFFGTVSTLFGVASFGFIELLWFGHPVLTPDVMVFSHVRHGDSVA